MIKWYCFILSTVFDQESDLLNDHFKYFYPSFMFANLDKRLVLLHRTQ